MTLADVATWFAVRLALEHEHLVVEVPLPAVGNSNSYLDLVQDFGDASLVCERLGACASDRRITWKKSGHMHVIYLTMRGYIADIMALELAQMAILLDYPNRDDGSLQHEYEEVLEASFDHIENICQASLIFPEIADHYLGNLVMGAYHEWEDADLLKAELQLHPERKYGFFMSRSISPNGLPVLSSDGQLIIPPSVPLEEVMEAIGYGDEKPLPANIVMMEREASFISDHAVVGIPTTDIINAIACGDEFVRRMQIDPDPHDLLSFQGKPVGKADEPSAHVGELCSYATLSCNGFTVLLLDVAPVTGWQRDAQADQLRSLETRLHDGGSRSVMSDFAWEALDDEIFEQLCYDYLYTLPFFDQDRLEKIGKSRSRDGGRDIVAWTKPAPPMFRAPVKYIFQCKHIRADSSLTTKHFQAVSDIIEQYGAGGYGVMCSGYIDATLHDKIDAIAARRGVGVRKVDRFQLEQFLSRRPHLIERYFKNFID